MTDIEVLPLQLDMASTDLRLTATDILASSARLEHVANTTFLNDIDPGFSAPRFTAQLARSLSGLKDASQDVRAIGDYVQLTKTRMVAADDGGAAATDPISGPLLRPGIGFGSEGLKNSALWWLDAYAFGGAVQNSPRIRAVGPALRAAGGRPGPTHSALAGIIEEVPGASSHAAGGLRHVSTKLAPVARRAADVSPRADDALQLSGRFADDIARAASTATSSAPLAKATKIAGPAVGLVGVAVDGHTAFRAYQDDDLEKSSIYAVRTLGGTIALAPGGQVVGLSVVGATYVVEYREELWGSVLSTLDFGKEALS